MQIILTKGNQRIEATVRKSGNNIEVKTKFGNTYKIRTKTLEEFDLYLEETKQEAAENGFEMQIIAGL